MLPDAADLADSAPAYDATQTADPSQATSQPAQSGDPNANVPFHLHPRWQERTREIQGLRSQNQQLSQQNQQINQRLQQLEQHRAQTGAPASAEEQALRDAKDALHRVDPTLKELPGQLEQINGVITGLAQDRFVASGERMIEGFAKQHGLDGAQMMQSLVQIIQSNPGLMARAQKGDLGLVSEWLSGLQPVVAAMKAQGTQSQRGIDASTAQTKRMLTTQVPPRQTGGQSGAAAPPTLDRAKDPSGREFMAQAHRDADALLQRGLRNQG